MTFSYEYARPALTVDCVVFGLDDEDLKVLLIKRDLKPFQGKWALPGGFVQVDETIDDAARRELAEETGLEKVFLEQLYTVGDLNRDPREKLAFDHDHILEMASERLRAKVRYQPIGFELLPKRFTLRQLQQLYEIVLDRELDKRNFRKKILGMGILIELDEVEKDVAHRAARLYRFDKTAYRRIEKQGFNFEI